MSINNKFKFIIFTLQDLSESSTSQILWKHLDTDIVKPKKFDSVERMKFEFNSTGYEKARELYDNKSFLFIRGANDGFLGMFTRQTIALAKWTIWLDLKAMHGRTSDLWMNWFFELCEELPILYGFGCSEEEYDYKHTTVRVLDGGGTATGTIGTSTEAFHEYLPGIYWLNIFGKHLVDFFDKDKITGAPNTNHKMLSQNQLALWIDSNVQPTDFGERLKQEQAITDHLGKIYFFDRYLDNTQFKAVPGFVKLFSKA